MEESTSSTLQSPFAMDVVFEDDESEETDLFDEEQIINDDVWCLLVPNKKNADIFQSKKDVITIGRDPRNDLILHNTHFFSRHHSEIRKNKLQNEYIDKSTNGSYINDKKIRNETYLLNNCDLISCDKTNVISYYFFEVTGYDINYQAAKMLDIFLTKDLSNDNVMKLMLNGDVYHYDNMKYDKQHKQEIVNQISESTKLLTDISCIIYEYFGATIFDAILFAISEFSNCKFCKMCQICGKNQDILRCARCKSVWYCGTKHQAKDWPFHQPICKPAKCVSPTAEIAI